MSKKVGYIMIAIGIAGLSLGYLCLGHAHQQGYGEGFAQGIKTVYSANIYGDVSLKDGSAMIDCMVYTRTGISINGDDCMIANCIFEMAMTDPNGAYIVSEDPNSTGTLVCNNYFKLK